VICKALFVQGMPFYLHDQHSLQQQQQQQQEEPNTQITLKWIDSLCSRQLLIESIANFVTSMWALTATNNDHHVLIGDWRLDVRWFKCGVTNGYDFQSKASILEKCRALNTTQTTARF
jgi:hypothetical protein